MIPLSALASGYLGGHIGLVATMMIGAAGNLLAAAPVLFSPLRTMSTLPDAVEIDEVPANGSSAAEVLEETGRA